MSHVRYVSLFSGIGGFELGIERAHQKVAVREAPARCALLPNGDRSHDSTGNTRKRVTSSEDRPTCVGFAEIDRHATHIYRQHFPHHEALGDITTIDAGDLPDCNLLVAGFPCQAFSLAGTRGGFADSRGTLFFEIARIAREKQPPLLLLENVKGLLSHDKGRTFGLILATLDELGYDLQWQVLNSKDFGVPQNRERVFVVGHLRGTPRPQVFPITGDGQTDCPIRLEDSEPDIWYLKASDWRVAERRDLCLRRLTPLECERLQGFPDGWTEGVSDTQRYKCLGNAVTVNVIEAIAIRLLTTRN